MSTPIALLAFLLGLCASLAASELLVRGLGRFGATLGLTAGLIGLLTALGADGPEISSAITALISGAKEVGLGVILGSNLFNLAALLGFSALVAGRITVPPRLLGLDGGVALWVTIVIGLDVLLGLSPLLSLALAGGVFLIYVVRLAMPRETVGRSGDVEVVERARVAAPSAPIWSVVPAVVVIVAGSVAMVNGALALGNRWHISQVILGAVILAAITSLPNAYAATRLALLGNGTAVVSLTFNSNALNLLAGVGIPALFIGRVTSSPGAAIDISWLLAMSPLTMGLVGLRGGLTRAGGGVLVVAYLLFIIFALR